MLTITITTGTAMTITIMTITGHDHDHHHHDHDDEHHAHEHGHGNGHGGGLKHYHDEDMQSVSLKTHKPVDPDKFLPWIQDLVQSEGPSILRCKGILCFKNDPSASSSRACK